MQATGTPYRRIRQQAASMLARGLAALTRSAPVSRGTAPAALSQHQMRDLGLAPCDLASIECGTYLGDATRRPR